MTSDRIAVIIPFVLYLVCMVAIGFYFYRRTKNISDYILGGRHLNRWVTSMSAQASDMSGWLLMGLPGFAFLAGGEALWIALGLFAGTYCNWKLVASRLRRFSETAGNAITLPEYFQNRFCTDSKVLRAVSALFILIFFLIYTASGFVAGAKLFSTVFAIPYTVALLAGICVIITYTFLGGFLAVSWTDFFQALIMFVAIVCVPLLAINATGGFSRTMVLLTEKMPHFLDPFTDISGNAKSFVSIVSLMAWGLGYFGQPHILARFMAIEKAEEIGQARRIAMGWVGIALVGALVVGCVGNAFAADLASGSSETIFMVLVERLVFPLGAGFLLAAILAAIMSTADSQLLVASSAVAEDLYRVFFRKEAAERELVWVSRMGVLVIAGVALVIALDPEASVLHLVSYAWAGFGATFGPLVLLSLYWKRMTGRGAVAGIIGGGITVIVWKQLHGGVFDLYEIVPGFVVSMVSILVTSLLDAAPPKGVEEVFRGTAGSG